MRTVREIKGSIDLMKAYLKQTEVRILNEFDLPEAFATLAEMKAWRDRIEQLQWVLEKPHDESEVGLEGR